MLVYSLRSPSFSLFRRVQELSWDAPLVLSGARVCCGGGGGGAPRACAQVWRVAFRCEVPVRDTTNRACAYMTSTRPAVWHVASGIMAEPVPGGTKVQISPGVATGHWFVVAE